MARSNNRNASTGARPVIKAELSEKNRTLRWILIIGFLALAIIFGYQGTKALLETEPGWAQVECASTEVNCSTDFIVSYYYGLNGRNASKEKRALTTVYSELVESAYQIFYLGLEPLSANVNRSVTVDPALYKALEQVQRYENRCLYLAPVYAEYARIFHSGTEEEARELDPAQNPELAAYIAQLASYANDPAMIDVQLLGDNQVCLQVSDEYAAFAAENEIAEFLDFGWMVNAFIADYLAEELTAAGFTNGFVSSYDGFTRNMDERGEEFSLNLFDRQGTCIYLPGIMQYDRSISIVFLRDFPMSERDSFHYYTFSDGRTVTAMVDPVDGVSKSAVASLTSYSYTLGCADILLQQSSVYLSDSLDQAALEKQDVFSLWFDGTVLYCNDSNMSVKLNQESDVEYTLEYVN